MATKRKFQDRNVYLEQSSPSPLKNTKRPSNSPYRNVNRPADSPCKDINSPHKNTKRTANHSLTFSSPYKNTKGPNTHAVSSLNPYKTTQGGANGEKVLSEICPDSDVLKRRGLFEAEGHGV